MSKAGKLVKALESRILLQATPEQIQGVARELGFAACVAREAAGELARRAVLLKKRELRQARKKTSDMSRKMTGKRFRRIMMVENITIVRGSKAPSLVREIHYHATKGFRSYRGSRR